MSTGSSDSTDHVQSTVGDTPSVNDALEPSASAITSDDTPQKLATRDSSDADEVLARDECTSGVEDSVGTENESSGIAKALSSMLSFVVRDFDSQAEDAGRSQDQLSFSLDRLTQELDQLLEDAPLPFIVQHAVKISGDRRRVSLLNSLLRSIQHHVDNIDRMFSTGSTQGCFTAFRDLDFGVICRDTPNGKYKATLEWFVIERYHWILTIINEEKNMVYLLDSMGNRNRDETWKTIVTNLED